MGFAKLKNKVAVVILYFASVSIVHANELNIQDLYGNWVEKTESVKGVRNVMAIERQNDKHLLLTYRLNVNDKNLINTVHNHQVATLSHIDPAVNNIAKIHAKFFITHRENVGKENITFDGSELIVNGINYVRSRPLPVEEGIYKGKESFDGKEVGEDKTFVFSKGTFIFNQVVGKSKWHEKGRYFITGNSSQEIYLVYDRNDKHGSIAVGDFLAKFNQRYKVGTLSTKGNGQLIIKFEKVRNIVTKMEYRLEFFAYH